MSRLPKNNSNYSFRFSCILQDELTKEFNTPLLDIGSDTDKLYQKTDFEDCCHLNTAGGEKFFAALVEYLGLRGSFNKKV